MPLPKIILIHGLNNGLEAFWPLRDSLVHLGFEIRLVCLPGHGENRNETGSWEEASMIFERSLKEITSSPYAVIAFSQGALYFQLWLNSSQAPKPVCQLLLAPALFVKNYERLNILMRYLPGKLIVPSAMPKILRRFPYLFINEYRHLFAGIKKYSESPWNFAVPTIVMIDPEDELVDAKKLKEVFGQQVHFVNRPYLKGPQLGKHHFIFHPDYFQKDDWQQFIQTITHFFSSF